jgi:hypothetical protein
MNDDGVRLDMLDFPTAWKIQEIGDIEHHPRCSSQPDAVPGMSGPHFLCDCGAVERAWRARRAAAGLPPG